MPLPSLPEPLHARAGRRVNARAPLTTELRSGCGGADERGVPTATGVRAAACDACSDGADRAGVRAAMTGAEEQAAMDDAVEAALEAAAAGAGMAAFASVPSAGNAGSWVQAALAGPPDLSNISPAPLSGRSRAQQEAAARRVATRASSKPKASPPRRHKSPRAPAETYVVDIPEGASPRELARLHGAARTMERLKHDLSMTRQMIQNGTHSARSKRAHTSELHALQDQLASVRRIFERQVHTHHVVTTFLYIYAWMGTIVHA